MIENEMLCDQKYLVWPECAKSDISSFPEERVQNERQVGQMRGKGARQEARGQDKRQGGKTRGKEAISTTGEGLGC